MRLQASSRQAVRARHRKGEERLSFSQGRSESCVSCPNEPPQGVNHLGSGVGGLLLAGCRPPFVSPTSSFSPYVLAVASVAPTPGLTRRHPCCGWTAVGRRSSRCCCRSIRFPSQVCRFRVCRSYVCERLLCDCRSYACRSYVSGPTSAGSVPTDPTPASPTSAGPTGMARPPTRPPTNCLKGGFEAFEWGTAGGGCTPHTMLVCLRSRLDLPRRC